MKKKVFAALLAVVMVLGSVAMAAGEVQIPVLKGMKLVVNGEELTPVNAAGEEIELFAYKDATYVPLRFLAELLGFEVVWDEANPYDAILNGDVPGAGKAIYTPGTYTGTADGYNGKVNLEVTFSKTNIVKIEKGAEGETAHVGTAAYDIMFPDILEANGSGVDMVAGATFTSRAIKLALNDAAEQAGCTDMAAFKKNTVKHEAQETQEYDYDVVVVGAGGAGMGAAAQAAQNGAKVLVIEKNAEVGGNTLCSGGAFQSVMPYLCWDPADPDADEAVWDYNGKTYTKVKNGNGAIETLKTIAGWSEEPFDADYYKDHEYTAGDIQELSKHGVHAEYLDTLKELKEEIKAYLAWAEPKLAAGTAESKLTLFSTVNLHIFQTYYGGLRQSADKTEWIYGEPDLVKQFITDGQELKTWLEDQGSLFNDADQSTLIGALWWRENSFSGGDMDGDGKMDIPAQYGTYFAVPMKTILQTSPTAKDNKIITRTAAKELIVEDGKVVGVKAVRYDGTEVIARAKMGVILATGGYAANISKVIETNKYWDPQYITASTKTTNRSSQVGDGVAMGEAVGAATVGMGWTQMMPISWIDNGNLAFGAGNYAVYINPTTGKRFVNESAERDVLSQGEFENGVKLMGSQGVFLEISNAETVVGFPYPYDTYVAPGVEAGATTGKTVIDNRVYFSHNAEELQAVLDKFGMEADAKVIYETIEAYDKAVMAGVEPPEVKKENPTKLVGFAEQDDNGKYKPETYKLDGELVRIRLMAPSTHHTMGGLKVDTERHVLREDGSIIDGLWAAGEVTGGIHGGNRLGGNAIVEIFVSGRTAANSVTAEASAIPDGVFEKTVAWDAEYDVVVVGLGAAGCATAITAGQEGAKVLVLEKAPEGYAGGNSAVCMQWACMADDKEQAMTYMKSMRENFQTPTDEMIEAYVDEIMKNEQWLKDLGAPNVQPWRGWIEFRSMEGAGGIYLVTVDGNVGFGMGGLKGSGALYKFMKKTAKNTENVEIWYEAPGQHLIQDKSTGIIHGVQAEVNGRKVNIRAKNGVVLACGGYENNERMLEDYNDVHGATPLGHSLYNTGDGIQMALEAGAKLWHMANIVAPNFGYRYASDAVTFGATSTGALNLGADGQKYVSWGGSSHGKAYFYGNYIQAAYPNYTWFVYDDETVKLGKVHNSFSDGQQWEIEHGYFENADTLEELAEKTGMPFETMKASIDAFNETADEGKKIEKAPFHAIKISYAVGNTQGGPERDTEGRVIDLYGNPIPHLYEAGEIGDVWSHCYQASCNIGGGLAFGRISGKNAAAAKDDNYQGSVMGGKSGFKPAAEEKTWECGEDQYIGKGEGKSTVPMTVRVTKKGEDITDVEILEFWDTPGFSDRAVEQTIAQIVEADKAVVDVVSGATMTSVGIMSAVADALK